MESMEAALCAIFQIWWKHRSGRPTLTAIIFRRWRPVPCITQGGPGDPEVSHAYLFSPYLHGCFAMGATSHAVALLLFSISLVFAAPSCSETAAACRRPNGPALLQVRGKLQKLRQEPVQLLANHDGNCLEASNTPNNGVGPSMQPCDAENDLQHWHYEPASGLLKHMGGGKCLDASQRNVRNGRIHLWDCDASNENQMWDWLDETKQLKNRYGLCMDAPHPDRVGSHVHMWTCRKDLSNQRWLFKDIDAAPTTSSTSTAPTTSSTTGGTTSATTTEASTETTTSTTSTTSTTGTTGTTGTTSTTSTTTPTPLRNCQLEPLVEGSGCKRLAIFEAEAFGLGENGQETQGRHRCLEKLRSFEEADSFVHAIGRCEVWQCITGARLKMSAGPGGGLSDSPDAIALVDWKTRYVTAEERGEMEVTDGSFVPEALFYLTDAWRSAGEVKPGRYTLKAASNGLYVKAIPGGRVVAETQKWDDWELFEMETKDDKVAFRSFHHSYLTAGADGKLWAGSWAREAQTEFTVVNRSLAAWEENHGAARLLPWLHGGV
eukprot:s152_g19.t1